MDKEALNKQIDEVSAQIVSNSKDARFAKKLVDELLSLKGQYDVEEVVMIVRAKDVLNEYDNDNIVLMRCKQCIIWRHRGGFSVVVEPRMRGLYEWLDGLLSLKDDEDKLTEDAKMVYSANYFGMSILMQIPMFAVADDELFFNIVDKAVEEIKKFSDKHLNNPELQEETPKENAEFEAKMKAAEEVLKDAGSK